MQQSTTHTQSGARINESLLSSNATTIRGYGSLSIAGSSTVRSITGLASLGSALDALQKGHLPDPMHELHSLLQTLKANHIPGPKLFRLKSEFSEQLGTGAESYVLGMTRSFHEELRQEGAKSETLTKNVIEGNVSKFIQSKGKIRKICDRSSTFAIKKVKPQTLVSAAQGDSPRTPVQVRAQELSSQLFAVHKEIASLCTERLRKHRNIVNLLHWGLCLDTLENPDEDSLRIPLLVLERAEFNLHGFLQTKTNVSQKTLRTICIDIGEGLGALHAEEFSHGDLKPENVLIFKQTNPKDVRHCEWTAKLCDFGRTCTDPESEKKKVSYTGTRGWRAPEALLNDNLASGGLQRCDLYAYGLIVWSVFTRRGNRVLINEEDERSTKMIGQAVKEVRALKNVAYARRRQILVVLKNALRSDPRTRSRSPWKAFLAPPYLSGLALSASYLMRRWSRMKMKISTQCSTLADHTEQSLRSVRYALSARVLPGTRENRSGSTRMQEVYEEFLAGDGTPLQIPKSNAHGEHECQDLETLYRIFQETFSNIVSTSGKLNERWHKMYCLARYRSQYRLCCWRKAQAMYLETAKHARRTSISPFGGDAVGFNVMLLYGYHPNEAFLIFSWLCRGSIGATELENAKNLRGLWQTVFVKSWQQAMDASQRLELFLLCLENGIHLEDPVIKLLRRDVRGKSGRYVDLTGPEPAMKSLLFSFMRLWGPHIENRVIDQICSHFARTKERDCISPRTRYYMTGQLPVHLDSLDGFSRTALHDSIYENSYVAVEALIRAGFVVSAEDSCGQTALERAVELKKNPAGFHIDRRAALASIRATHGNDYPLPAYSRSTNFNQLDRIINLLEQNQGIGSIRNLPSKAPDTNRDSHPPRGWELMTGNKIYLETYTESLTLQPPDFSLLEDRRLALGYRRFTGGEGQTYHLDLITFLDSNTGGLPDRAEDRLWQRRLPVHDDAWYAAETFMPVEAQMDVVGRIVESDPYKMPQLRIPQLKIPKMLQLPPPMPGTAAMGKKRAI